VATPVAWIDLTVPDAAGLKDFYADVMGWTVSPISMGDYDDYAMVDSNGSGVGVAGVCHARGVNAAIPPVWMPYFRVDDVAAAVARCLDLGGELIKPVDPPQAYGVTAFLRDPQGTAFGLVSPAGSRS
jgi:predicted enzyme related to lactoylglutathione lyase